MTWVGTEEVPITFISHFLGQVDDRCDVLLTFGQTTPPVLMGTPDEVAHQIERLAYVPVKPIARFSMSRPRLIELVKVLQDTLDNQQKARQAMTAHGEGDML